MTFHSAAIYGQPVSHSRSPFIHAAWLREHGISGAYLKKEVSPEELPQLLKDFRSTGLAGANLTLPLKEVACAYVGMDEVASKLQAVNMIWMENGRLYGTNTDAYGFMAACDAQAPQWRSALGHVVVLGAGGAAKAVLHAVLEAGAERITVVNRTVARAENLRALFGKKVSCEGWDGLSQLLPQAQLLINATSLGMKGMPPLDLNLESLNPKTIVADIVYVPLETAFLKKARERGHATVDGLSMLLHQAVPAFERWFGIKPAVTKELLQLVSADLQT